MKPDAIKPAAGATTIELIETLRVEPGRHAPLLAIHWRRLEQSCQALGYDWPGESLLQAVQQHIAGLDMNSTYRLRLLLGPHKKYSLESSVLPVTNEPVQVLLSSSPLRAERFWLQHKTTYRPWYAQDQVWLAQHPDFFDVVYCNIDDEVCEGSRSNVYMLNNAGIWLTPPLACGLLPGVQRQFLLDTGRAKEARITRQELISAPETRISNALRGWLDATLCTPS